MEVKSFINDTVILEDERVRLEPMGEEHFEVLYAIAQQKELWAYTAAKINAIEDFKNYFAQALQEKQAGISYPFAILDKQLNRYGGCTRFGNISLPHKRLEIGWTWYDTALQRTGLNRHCKFLLLIYCFETLGLNRVELKTSLLNLRSQKAMEDIGAVKEGVLRRHMINEDGEVRDTLYYSFIKQDWQEIKRTVFKNYY